MGTSKNGPPDIEVLEDCVLGCKNDQTSQIIGCGNIWDHHLLVLLESQCCRHLTLSGTKLRALLKLLRAVSCNIKTGNQTTAPL